MGTIEGILRGIPVTITESLRKVFAALFVVFCLLAMYTLFSCQDLMSCLPRVSEYLFLAIIFGVLGFAGKGKRPRRAAVGCDKARSDLEWAKKVKRALQTLIPSVIGTRTTDEYKEALHSYLRSETGMETQAPMGVDPWRCCIGPGGPEGDPRYAEDWAKYREYGSDPARFEAYIKSKYFSDQPDIVWDAARTHEEIHINQCAEEHRDAGMRGYVMYLEDPENYRQDDLEAYEAQIRKLQEWIDAHCR